MGRIALPVLALLILSFAAASTLANGVYMPPIATPAMPSIPSQRAMIVFRDGSETLIVESTFQSPASDVAWILPVPAAPTKIEPLAPALLGSVVSAMSPAITSNARHWLTGSAWLLLISIFSGLNIYRIGINLTSLLQIFAFIFFTVLFQALLLASPNRSEASLSVLESRRIGNYEVKSFQGSDLSALEAWLTQNNLRPLAAEHRAVFQHYLKEGWTLLAAHLRQDDPSKPATPHPLAVTFPAKNAIFPMRATQLAGSETAVDLVIVNDRQASATEFDTVAADQFEFLPESKFYETSAIYSAAYKAKALPLTIGHPDAASHLWPGCVVTHLAATLKPDQMQADVEIPFTPMSQASQQRKYSPRARLEMVIGSAVLSCAILFFICAVAWRQERIPPRERRFIAGFAAVAALSCTMLYAALPVIPVIESTRVERVQAMVRLRSQLGDMRRAIDKEPVTLASLADIQSLKLNAFTKEPNKPGQAPGNYTLREIAGRPYVCLYDYDSREIRVPVASSTTKPATNPANGPP